MNEIQDKMPITQEQMRVMVDEMISIFEKQFDVKLVPVGHPQYHEDSPDVTKRIGEVRRSYSRDMACSSEIFGLHAAISLQFTLHAYGSGDPPTAPIVSYDGISFLEWPHMTYQIPYTFRVYDWERKVFDELEVDELTYISETGESYEGEPDG